MPNLRRALVGSLAFNLLLGAVYWLQLDGPPGKAKPALKPAAPGPASTWVVVKRMTSTVAVAVAAQPKMLDWHAGKIRGLQQYVANLRAAGCPERTVRDVIIADVNDLYRQRYRELLPPTNRVEYWKPGNPLASLLDDTRLTQEHALAAEKRALLRTLLGGDYTDDEDLSAIRMDSMSERLLSFLTPAKRTAMKELEDKFAVRMMKTYKDTWRGNEAPAEAVQAEKDEAMLQVLTPADKFEYDVRRSDTAMFMRVGLGRFEPSEAEFRAMFPCLKEFIAQAGKPGFGLMLRGELDPRPEGVAARLTLQEKLNGALGDERFGRLLDQDRLEYGGPDHNPDAIPQGHPRLLVGAQPPPGSGLRPSHRPPARRGSGPSLSFRRLCL